MHLVAVSQEILLKYQLNWSPKMTSYIATYYETKVIRKIARVVADNEEDAEDKIWRGETSVINEKLTEDLDTFIESIDAEDDIEIIS